MYDQSSPLDWSKRCCVIFSASNSSNLPSAGPVPCFDLVLAGPARIPFFLFLFPHRVFFPFRLVFLMGTSWASCKENISSRTPQLLRFTESVRAEHIAVNCRPTCDIRYLRCLIGAVLTMVSLLYCTTVVLMRSRDGVSETFRLADPRRNYSL